MSFDRRKIRTGTVISDKMDKTVDVQVEWRRAHFRYGKAMKRRSRLKAHDEANECHLGDLVRVMETRPLSKTKRWRVVEILARGDVAEIQPEEIGIDESVAVATPTPPVVEEPVAKAEDAAVAVPPAEEAAEEPETEPEAEEAPEPEPMAEAEEPEPAEEAPEPEPVAEAEEPEQTKEAPEPEPMAEAEEPEPERDAEEATEAPEAEEPSDEPEPAAESEEAAEEPEPKAQAEESTDESEPEEDEKAKK